MTYLVIFLPGTASFFVEHFAGHEHILTGVHLSVLRLLIESLQSIHPQSICRYKKGNTVTTKFGNTHEICSHSTRLEITPLMDDVNLLYIHILYSVRSLSKNINVLRRLRWSSG